MPIVISSILRFLLAALSIVSLILGIAVAAIGGWLMGSKNMLRSILNLVDTSKMPSAEKGRAEAEVLADKYDIISTVGLTILLIGIFIAAVAFCGALGSICKMKILLVVYIMGTSVMFVSLVIALIYFGTLKARFANEIKVKLSAMQDQYMVSLLTMVKNEDSVKTVITAAFNFMHLSLKCCGINEIGDTRLSASWRASQRSLMDLAKLGVPLKLENSSGQAVPQWLKGVAPPSLAKLPPGVGDLPAELPQGFSLPPDFKQTLGNLVGANNLTASNFDKLMNDSLTIMTPITCCEVADITAILKKIDVKTVYDQMKSPSCPFSESNTGVYTQTCHQAYLDYISRYQRYVISFGTTLAVVIGFGLLAAVWIFFFDSA